MPRSKWLDLILILVVIAVLGSVWGRNQKVAPASPPTSSSDLLLSLPLDGEAQDASSYHHKAVSEGIAPAPDRNGREGGACRFSEGSFVQILDVQDFNNLSEFTMSAWIYPTRLREHLNIVSKVTPNRDFNLQVSAAGRVVSHIMNGAYEFCYSASSIKANQWTFVTATYRDKQWKVYLNGQLDAQITVKKSPPWTGQLLTVGNLAPGSSEAFLGSLDDVRVYRRALDDVEIRALMNP